MRETVVLASRSDDCGETPGEQEAFHRNGTWINAETQRTQRGVEEIHARPVIEKCSGRLDTKGKAECPAKEAK